MYRSSGYSGGVVSTQHRGRPLEDARAGGAWRVWVRLLSSWGVSDLCHPPQKAILAFSGGFGNLPWQDCHLVVYVPSWAPRRASRDPDIHSGLVGAVFLRIGVRSCVVQTGLWRGGTPANGVQERLERARRGSPAGLGGRALHSTRQLVIMHLSHGEKIVGGKWYDKNRGSPTLSAGANQ